MSDVSLVRYRSRRDFNRTAEHLRAAHILDVRQAAADHCLALYSEPWRIHPALVQCHDEGMGGYRVLSRACCVGRSVALRAR
jgi:hypothetical protein